MKNLIPLSEKLRRIAKRLNVRFLREPIPLGIPALFATGPDMENLVIIDKDIEEQARINAYLAHELGHVNDDAPANLFDIAPMLAEKAEARANRFAVDVYLSLDRIVAAYLYGCREPWEFSEYLEISQDAYVSGMEALKSRYGTREVVCGKYRLCFNPYRVRGAV